MKISVITVCFNSERTIRETIQSFLDQDYASKELYIIDGVFPVSTCGTEMGL